MVFLIILNMGMRIKLNDEINCSKEMENKKKKKMKEDSLYIQEKYQKSAGGGGEK
jgi:hypothetical protein